MGSARRLLISFSLRANFLLALASLTLVEIKLVNIDKIPKIKPNSRIETKTQFIGHSNEPAKYLISTIESF